MTSILSKTKWTQFWDMRSGGGSKEKHDKIYIEAPMAEAKLIFQNRFGHNPERITCTCCGDDYAIHEGDSLEVVTAFHRGCDYDVAKDQYVDMPKTDCAYDPYLTLEQYATRQDVLIIRANEIKDSERVGDLKRQGYSGLIKI